MQTSISGTVLRPRGHRGAAKRCSQSCGLETRLGWQLPRRAGARPDSSSVLTVPVSFWALLQRLGLPESPMPPRCVGGEPSLEQSPALVLALHPDTALCKP